MLCYMSLKRQGQNQFRLTEAEEKWLVIFFFFSFVTFLNFYCYDRSPIRLSMIRGCETGEGYSASVAGMCCN